MPAKKGKFIVIDGSDGAGKKTQSDLLIKRLLENKYDVAYYDFPQYYSSFFGKMTGEFLTGKYGAPENMNPYIASLLYAGDRWQASKLIAADLNAGKVVVANRFTSSNMAHQAGKITDIEEKERYLDWLHELEHGIYKIPEPDMVIYLYVPLEVSQRLLIKKGERGYVGKTKDRVESDVNYLNCSINEYLRLVEKYPHWQKINCVKRGEILDIEEIADQIWQHIESKLRQEANVGS